MAMRRDWTVYAAATVLALVAALLWAYYEWSLEHGATLLGVLMLLVWVWPLVIDESRSRQLVGPMFSMAFSCVAPLIFIPSEEKWLQALFVVPCLSIGAGSLMVAKGIKAPNLVSTLRRSVAGRFAYYLGSRIIAGAALGTFFTSFASSSGHAAEIGQQLTMICGVIGGCYGFLEWATHERITAKDEPPDPNDVI
jgi:hypothetical protein